MILRKENQIFYALGRDPSSLDGVGEEAEDGAEPEEHGEPAEEVLRELDPLWRGWGRREGVGPVALAVGLGLRLGQARLQVGAQALAQLRERDAVRVQVELLLQLVQLLGRRLGGCNERRCKQCHQPWLWQAPRCLEPCVAGPKTHYRSDVKLREYVG